MLGNVFVNPSAPDARAAPFFKKCVRKKSTATYGENVLFSMERPEARIDETNMDIRSSTTEFCRKFFNLESSLYCRRGFNHKILWLNSQRIRSRRRISINFPRLRQSSFGRRASKQKHVLVLVTLRRHCVGSKKWRWPTRWMIPIFEMLDAKIDSSPKKITQSTWQSRRLN